MGAGLMRPPAPRPNGLSVTLTHGAPGTGLCLSRDGGAAWSPISGLSFGKGACVVADPEDADTLFISTLGGSAWRGPAAG